jgi:hypothetical protein
VLLHATGDETPLLPPSKVKIRFPFALVCKTQERQLIISYRIITLVRWLNISDVSGIISVHVIAMMMGAEMVPETSVIFKQLTWMIAREDFINVCQCESFTSNKNSVNFVAYMFSCMS